MAQLAQELRERHALGEQQAHLAVARQVAGGGEHEVAQAAQPHEGLGLRAQRQPEPRHLGEAACDQRGACVEAELQAVRDAGGDREHVLHRAADLDAHRVVGGVDAQAVAVQRGHRLVAQRLVGAGGDERGGLAARHLDGEARTRQHAGTQVRPQRARQLVAQRTAALLEALAQPQHTGCGPRQARQHPGQRRHRRRDHDEPVARMRHRGVEIRVHVQRLGQHRAGQVAFVAPRAAQALDLRRIACPQPRGMAHARVDRERRAPGARAEDREVHAPVSSRW